MTDDLELETRLRAHYRELDPGPVPVAWMRRVERSLDARGRTASAARRFAILTAAAVVVAIGVVGGLQLIGPFGSVASPSPSLPAGTVIASQPALSGAPPTATATTSAEADLVGTFSENGIWTIRGDQLLVSTDKGATWRPGSAPTTASPDGFGPRAATMYDATIGWVVTSGPGTTAMTGAPTDVQTLVAYRTIDGGKTWRSAQLGGSFPGVSVSIAFVDNLRGYILVTPLRQSLSRATVFATTDGGATWSIAGTNDTWALDAPLGSHFSVSSTGVLFAGANQEAGPNSHPLAAFSLDGGATWRLATVPGLEGRAGGVDTYFVAPPTADATVSAAVVDVLPSGTTTHLYATDGQDWGDAGSVPGAASTGVMDLGNGHWLIGMQNPQALMMTLDGGQTWHAVTTIGLPSPVSSTIMDGGTLGATHAWMRISTDNSPNGSGELFLTADSGRTWTEAAFGVPAPAVTAVDSPSPQAPPSDTPPGPSPTDASASPTPEPSIGHDPPAAWGALSVGQLSPGPSGTTQVTRWAGGWIALDNETHAAAWLSHDGRVWFPVPNGRFGQPAAIAMLQAVPFRGGLLVFAEATDGTDTAWRSDDGMTWRSTPVERVAFGTSTVASDGAVVVAIRNDGMPGALSSSDGQSWGLGAVDDGSVFNPTSVVYRPGLGFVAVGANKDRAAAWTSEDGLHWTPAIVSGWQAVDDTLSNLVAGSGGLVAMGSTGGTPGAFSHWVGSLTGLPGHERVAFALSAADPLGKITEGEGAGSNIGTVSGDGTWMLEWGTRSGGTKPELWASQDGTSWTRVALTPDLSSAQVSRAFPVGDAILFAIQSGETDWLGDMAGPG